MTQVDLFTAGATAEALPSERIESGVRYCRHHPGRPIPRHAYPCGECRREGCGGATPEAEPPS